jgi:signal transduction histidine kinase
VETREYFDEKLGLWVEATASPILDADGNMVGSVHIIKDVSDRKAAELKEQQLREKAEMSSRLAAVGEMAAGIAHEINNPLTGILGFSELLMENNLPENLRADVETIHSEANRAAGIIKNLLVFARQHHQVREELDVNEVVERVLTLRAYEANLNNIQVVRHLAPDIPMIIGDHFQLQQVFLNLVIKARLFDPFFTTKDVGQGTGLGLSISHGVIKQHGGTIRVESQPGQGASFIIELPLKPSPEEAVS